MQKILTRITVTSAIILSTLGAVADPAVASGTIAPGAGHAASWSYTSTTAITGYETLPGAQLLVSAIDDGTHRMFTLRLYDINATDATCAKLSATWFDAGGIDRRSIQTCGVDATNLDDPSTPGYGDIPAGSPVEIDLYTYERIGSYDTASNAMIIPPSSSGLRTAGNGFSTQYVVSDPGIHLTDWTEKLTLGDATADFYGLDNTPGLGLQQINGQLTIHGQTTGCASVQIQDTYGEGTSTNFCGGPATENVATVAYDIAPDETLCVRAVVLLPQSPSTCLTASVDIPSFDN